MFIHTWRSHFSIWRNEFTIIVPEITHEDQVQRIAQEVNSLFHQPFILKETEHSVTTSIGIALFPDHGDNATTLIMNADRAMYRAKEEGKNQYRFYDSTLNLDAEAIMNIYSTFAESKQLKTLDTVRNLTI